MPAKPPDQPKKSFYTLAEGDQQDEVKVLKIDDKAGSVEVSLMGTVTNLTFSAKMPPAAPPGAPPGQPNPGIPPPMSTGINPATGAPGGFQRTLPGRPIRSNNPAEGGVAPQGSAASGQPQTQSIAESLNRDETALVIEAERERLRQSGDPLANLMPITHLTPS